ncbi:hypothetical protein ACFSSC_02855 [Corynebacterium mendelii]|uniref:DUF4352 domain-containing protein n=1 Tax=Corynebacterium mendelii TaxID=2765362 RepID=A0A939E2C7_9CORY|nr:hypothetical protein [Corynebacterium mendelii]MBN9644217.1 hypothetical protein [Corynebacterium mendelii]
MADNNRLRRSATGAALGLVGLAASATTGCTAIHDFMNEDRAPLVATVAPIPEADEGQPTSSFVPAPPVPTTVTESLVSQPPVDDAQLNCTWRLQSLAYGNLRGGVVHLMITNNNPVPLPPSAIPEPVLVVRNPQGEETVIDLLDEQSSGIVNGLDVPLGPHATTTISYAVDTTPPNAYDATLTIGDVSWQGNLGQV